MTGEILIDTGPLVALINRRDRYHDWAVRQVEALTPPLLTCELVLAETCYLLRGVDGGTDAVLRLLQRGLITTPFRLDEEASWIRRMVGRYSNVPMSLADACLVRLAEQNEGATVLTLDSDFHIYRKSGRQVVPTIMPTPMK